MNTTYFLFDCLLSASAIYTAQDIQHNLIEWTEFSCTINLLGEKYNSILR